MRTLSGVAALSFFALVFSAQPPGAAKAATSPKDFEAVISLGHSLNVRLHPVPVSSVKLPDGFWGTRNRLIVDRTLPALRQQLELNGTIDNFLRAAGKKNTPRRGRPSSDADLYRWIEAASWAIASPDTLPAGKQKFQADIESLIPLIAGAQDASGYLDTYFAGDRAHLRFTDLVHSHEDVCLARLLVASIAYYRSTQNRGLLDIGRKFADNVASTFGPSAKPFVAAHPELIGAFVELYRTVGETKYLDFARYLLGGNERDRLHLKDSDIHYMFSGKPFPSRTELEGQAVNALEAASGATDYFAESGDPSYRRAIDLLWNDLVLRRISVAGGVALRSSGDTLSEPYEVGGGSTVAEVPAAIANTGWNLRLLALTGDARYADILETALYNAVSAGISQTGAFSCGHPALQPSGEKKTVYYDTESCPPNISTLFCSLGSYFYATALDGLYIALFNDSELDWHLEDGTGIRVVQSTNYPWDGEVRVSVYPSKPAQFAIHVRWPGWAPSLDVSVNGEKISGDFQPGTFVAVSRTWQSGDVITLNFSIQPSLLRANPRAADLWGKAALQRGPLVYALQQADQGPVPITDTFLRLSVPGTAEFHKDLLGGITLLKFPGFAAERPLASQPLYGPWKDAFVQNRRSVNLIFSPYFTAASRDPENLETWVPVLRSPDIPAPSSTAPLRPGGTR
jgi:hypothetical protein